jgi:hypothetical protein
MPAVMLAIGIMVGPGVQVVANNSSAPADRGLDHLLHRGYLPADFDQEVFDSLWTTWEEPLRSQAEGSGLAERRRMAMDRYGLLPRIRRDLSNTSSMMRAAGQ